jgi:Zn-dependent protease
MSLDEHDDARDEEHPARRFGRPGGDWRGLRPSFDNPLSWSLPIGRAARIGVRVHVVFLIFIIIELVKSVASPHRADTAPHDFSIAAILMGSWFLIVLLHEFGHCLACRGVGGEADEILMWPLGGLAFCRPPQVWQAHFITVAGGLMVNVAILVVLGAVIGAITGHWWGVAVPDVLNLGRIFYNADVAGHWWLLILAIVNWANLVILIFNLLPMYPLDGGRLVQALLWPRLGYTRSMRISVRIGFVGGLLLAIAGFVMQDLWLLCMAGFGLVTCYTTNRQLEFTNEMMGFESDEYALSLHCGPDDAAPDPRPTRAQRRAAREAQRQREESEALDRILQKIADSGMESLTGRERTLLRRATARKRSGQ